jgi:hypothetical protein
VLTTTLVVPSSATILMEGRRWNIIIMKIFNPRINQAIYLFNEIYIDGIPLLVHEKSAFLSFILVITAIEALSGYRYGKGNLEHRFTSFIEEYFPKEYKMHSDNLWKFRKKMVHAFSTSSFALIHNHPHLHFSKTPDGRTILNADDFYKALKYAAEKYFKDLYKNNSIQATMIKRLDDEYTGGSIGVFTIIKQQ